MKRIICYFAGFSLCSFALFGQSSLSFYHLGATTFQNGFYNPAYIPEGKIFIGLPGLSGIHLNYNNKFGYNDVIVREGANNRTDLHLLLSNLQRNNMMSISADISLFHVGITTINGIHFSLYANERIQSDFLYPKSLFEFGIEGNATLLGEKIKVGKTRLSAQHFREIGLGVAMPLSDYNLSVGIKVKYLQGFMNASTPGNLKADIVQDPVDLSIDLDMKNFVLRTSGVGVFQGKTGDLGPHLISNSNRGAAIDLGVYWDMNRYNAISGSITDLGFISWKEDIKNHNFGDTTLSYSGIHLDDPGDLEQTIKDSLINRFKNKKSETTDPYTTMLSPQAYVSWIFHAPSGGDVVTTIGSRYIQGQMKLLGGVGYRHSFGKFFTGTLNVTKLPQQFLNLGAAVAVKGGPAQLYLAVDQLVNFDATNFQAIDVRFGINFIFGQSGDKKSKSVFDNQKGAGRNKPAKANSSIFLGSEVKVKGQEGIYTIIDKQERRKKGNFTSKPKKEKTRRKRNLRGQRDN